ncbi:transcriptional regulator, TetR family [Bacillus sp. JCM 19046]|nr:transcriptional regulator, TetR family [Bacillus sp. JCM 19046]
MNTKDRITAVALRAFATHGYEGTTLAQIASEVGIQKPSLYNHYKNKDELYLTVAHFIMNALVEQIETSSVRYKNEELATRLKLVLKESCEFIIQKQEGVMYKRFMLFPPVELKKRHVRLFKKEMLKLTEYWPNFTSTVNTKAV